MEAMSVPRPPMLVPTSRSSHASVKPESSSAAGTLLMIWLMPTDARRTCPSNTWATKLWKAGKRFMLPMKTKRHTKVASRL